MLTIALFLMLVYCGPRRVPGSSLWRTLRLAFELVRHVGLLRREQVRVAVGRFLCLAAETVDDIEGGEPHVDEHGDVVTPQVMDANALDSQGAACAQSRDGDRDVGREARAARGRRDRRR